MMENLETINTNNTNEVVGNSESKESKTLADKLRVLIATRGIKQAEIIAKTGISKPTLSRYLCNRTDLRSSDLYKLLAYLGIDLSEIVTFKISQSLSNVSF